MPADTRFFALIPCAGQGSRAGAPMPKQYQTVAGRPMVLHTLAAFTALPELASVTVVVAPGDHFLDNAKSAAPAPTWQVAACGGATRAQSVLGGLNALRAQGAHDTDWVLVHDAARCLITSAQIRYLMQACADHSVGGLLALPLPDTLKQAVVLPGQPPRVAATVVRHDKWLAQTPQMFRLGPLRLALQSAGDTATDESSAMEAQGHAPLLVTGSAQNFKVTYPEDFALAEAVLLARLAAAVV